MSQLSAYLFFNGNCAEAMRFYESTLGGTLNLMKQGDSPVKESASADKADLIMHARLVFDGGTLMASDWIADYPYERPQGVSLSLTYPKGTDVKQVFDSLAEGGRVNMPLQKTFWSEAFGMLVDRFGTPWMINVE